MNKYEAILERSKAKHKFIMKQMQFLNRKNKSGFEAAIHKYHDEVFSQIDCKECGLCCKNISPIFRKSDIKHICAYVGTPEKPFKEKYLMQDPDGVGFMLKNEPCPFQNEDNTCSVYEVRTLSCKNFPHTDEKNITRKLGGLALDSLFCPAAFLIIEKILDNYGSRPLK